MNVLSKINRHLKASWTGGSIVGKDGAAATEFLIVFPTFFFLCLMTIEICLMWADRHVLHLASFEASRVIALGEGPNICEDQTLLDKAVHKAALKVAAISPSVPEVLATLLDNDQYQDVLDRINSGLDQAVGNSSIAQMLRRLALGYPTAGLLLSIIACSSTPEETTVTLRYLRHPRMPYAGTALWSLFVLEQLAQMPTGQWLEFDLDNSYFNVEVKSPQLQNAQATIGRLRQDLSQLATTVTDAGLSLDSISDQLQGFGIGNLLPSPSIANLTQDLTTQIVRGAQQLDAEAAQAQNSLTELSNQLNGVGSYLGAMLYRIPVALRMVPMEVTTTTNRSFRLDRGDEPWRGRTMFVGPFNGPSNGKTYDDWRRWAHGLSTDKTNIGGLK